jgi:hypothetical protein
MSGFGRAGAGLEFIAENLLWKSGRRPPAFLVLARYAAPNRTARSTAWPLPRSRAIAVAPLRCRMQDGAPAIAGCTADSTRHELRA